MRILSIAGGCPLDPDLFVILRVFLLSVAPAHVDHMELMCAMPDCARSQFYGLDSPSRQLGIISGSVASFGFSRYGSRWSVMWTAPRLLLITASLSFALSLACCRRDRRPRSTAADTLISTLGSCSTHASFFGLMPLWCFDLLQLCRRRLRGLGTVRDWRLDIPHLGCT